MPRYKGTIVKMTNQHCGFIDRKTVTRISGEPVNFKTRLDIFVHKDDVEDQTVLELGSIITFEIRSDPKRKTGLRADCVREAGVPPIFGGIELHFDEQVIDHPLVPIRWCIKPEIFDLMRNQKDRQWAIVLVAQTQRSANPDLDVRRREAFKTVIGIQHIGDGHGYFTFPAPGDYDLVTYLINSSDSPFRFARTLDRSSKYVRDVWDDDELETSSRLSFLSGTETLVALSHVPVSVPEGIFAKPLPRWVNNWLGYFGLQKPRDECSTRGRLFLAFTLGLVWYLFWEATKRSYMLLLGVAHLLFGGNPLIVWKKAVRRRLSAYVSNILVAGYEYEPLMHYQGWKVLLHPSLLLALFSGTAAWIFFPKSHANELEVIVDGALGTIFVVLILGGFQGVTAAIRMFTKKSETTTRSEKILARVETYAVCGIQEPNKTPVTIRLVWTGIKRRVCRTYYV